MSRPLRVLLVDDSEDDALLVVRELRRGGWDPDWERVETREEMATALDRAPWDLVVSDFRLPAFSGPEALALHRERGAELPFLMVSGMIGEEQAVECLKSGADDFFLKGNLTRLRPAVERELAEAENRRARRRVDRELKRQRDFLRQVIDQSPNLIFAKDREGRFTLVNRALAEAYGTTVEDMVGRTDADFNDDPDQVAAFRRDDLEVIDTGREKVMPEERLTDAAGRVRWMHTVKRPLAGGDGKGDQVFGMATDITERKRAAEELARSQERFRLASDIAKVGVWDWDLETGEIYVDPTLKALLGFEDSELPNQIDAWSARVHPEDRDTVMAEAKAHIEGRTPLHELEHRMLHKDGSMRWFLVRGTAVRDAAGKARRMVGADMDVSEQHGLQQQLSQAQKMEAVGRLAGGIAHDFNNLIGVITGYSELLQRGIRPEDPSRRRLEQIRDAGERAAVLTRQLLAFSRKQVLNPRVVDLNGVVEGIEEMLRRVIGEDVQLRTALAGSLGPVRVDPGQVEQVVMNLVVNARDAMPGGGQLVIETRDVELNESYARQHVGARAGPHVLLAVSDTGHGIDPETLPRVFEPFFTTKEAGKGTGLGLATVHGIVAQSGGHVNVYSEPGRGTTFKIYLPAAPGAREETDPDDASGAAVAPGNETILLVEDDESLREMIREILDEAGYTVLEHAAPEAALERAHAGGEAFELLLTDVVLPGINGPALAKRVQAARPGVRVLFMSGYTDETIVHHGAPRTATLLEKPFTAKTLLRKVRHALETAKRTGRPR